MKKKIAMLVAVTLAVGLVACGNTAKKTEEGVTISESGAGKTTEAEPEPEPEPDPRMEWLDSKGIVIEPQGAFSYVTTTTDGREFDVPATVTITESTDDVEEGFKRVIATFESDMSGSGEEGYSLWHSAFDRYTGTSFEFDSTQTKLSQGENKRRGDSIMLNTGDEEYEVAIFFDSTNNYPTWKASVEVICPVDYDGTVFYVGYSSEEIHEANQEIDYGARLYTIDELPYYGEGKYKFFSYTND